jgi:hypothetical protein
MFQFPGFASATYEFSHGYHYKSGGFPHSEIPGSTIARISPGLIAACHVLHRLSTPRHPPDALDYLFSTPHQRPTRAWSAESRSGTVFLVNYRPSACLSSVFTAPNQPPGGLSPRTRALRWHEAPSIVRDDRRVSPHTLRSTTTGGFD